MKNFKVNLYYRSCTVLGYRFSLPKQKSKFIKINTTIPNKAPIIVPSKTKIKQLRRIVRLPRS